MVHTLNEIPRHNRRALTRIQRLLHRLIAIQLRHSGLIIRCTPIALAPRGEPVRDLGEGTTATVFGREVRDLCTCQYPYNRYGLKPPEMRRKAG
jgi:hypothetical protein